MRCSPSRTGWLPAHQPARRSSLGWDASLGPDEFRVLRSSTTIIVMRHNVPWPVLIRVKSRIISSVACPHFRRETGAFWSSAVGTKINRRHRVDRDLLVEISALEDLLTDPTTGSQAGQGIGGMPRELAQRFIGRWIFTWYLLDRGLAQPFLPESLPPDLSQMFASTTSAFALFDWLRATDPRPVRSDVFRGERARWECSASPVKPLRPQPLTERTAGRSS
jgi:hypothetical protein